MVDDDDDDDDDGGVHSIRFIRICFVHAVFNAPVLVSITLTICFLRYT